MAPTSSNIAWNPSGRRPCVDKRILCYIINFMLVDNRLNYLNFRYLGKFLERFLCRPWKRPLKVQNRPPKSI